MKYFYNFTANVHMTGRTIIIHPEMSASSLSIIQCLLGSVMLFQNSMSTSPDLNPWDCVCPGTRNIWWTRQKLKR